MRPSRRTSIAAGLLAGSLLLTACGGDDSSSSSGGSSSGSATPDVVVKASDSPLKFDQASYTAKAGKVGIELLNDPGGLQHSLRIDGKSGFRLEVTGKGKSEVKTVDLKAGTYTIYCDIAGHRSAGMESKLVVS